jgi:hypothetical protein
MRRAGETWEGEVLSAAGTLITITYTLQLPVVSKVSNKLQDIKVKSASERPVKT